MRISFNLPADAVEFTSGDEVFAVDADAIPEASALRIFLYGRRMFNDSVNSSVNRAAEKWGAAQTPKQPASKCPESVKTEARERAAREWIQAMRDGKLGESRGPAADELTQELRAIVSGYLRQAGLKAKDAGELAKDPEAGFRAFLELSLKGKYGARWLEHLEPAFEVNWPNVEAQAQRVVDMRRPPSLSM